MAKSKVFLRSVKDQSLQRALDELFDKIGWESIIQTDASVVIKTNHGAYHKKAVECSNTSNELVKSVCEIIKERTNKITVVESDGPRHKAEDVWKATGLDRLCQQIGVNLVNLSKEETKSIIDHPIFKQPQNGLPSLVLDADVFIDMPKIKTHALTQFTGSVKNLWGCVPRFDRVLLHHYLDELISDLVGLLKPQIGIMDGIMCMEGCGPTNGKARNLDVILVSKDVVALDCVSSRLIGIDPYEVKHLILANQKGFGNIDAKEIVIDGHFERFKTQFEPAILDWPNRITNYMTRYPWFVKYILFNDSFFYIAKKTVNVLRKTGLAGRTLIVNKRRTAVEEQQKTVREQL